MARSDDGRTRQHTTAALTVEGVAAAATGDNPAVVMTPGAQLLDRWHDGNGSRRLPFQIRQWMVNGLTSGGRGRGCGA
jgi:hypothetical protein